MLKQALLLLTVLTLTRAQEARRYKYEDPFTALDRHITHTLAYHYLWPWSQLVRAAAALDAEEQLEEPQIVNHPERFMIVMSAKRFKPGELRVKVKNRYVIVEGKHKEENDNKRFMANHFVQRFVMPPGTKPEEVTAIFYEGKNLTISAPKHELPPPPPDREILIDIVPLEDQTESIDIETTTKPEKVETSSERKELPSTQTSTPLEQLDMFEATTHAGKIRKKELKAVTKTPKDNEVSKGVDGNGLDYALIEAEE